MSKHIKHTHAANYDPSSATERVENIGGGPVTVHEGGAYADVPAPKVHSINPDGSGSPGSHNCDPRGKR